MGRDEGGCSRRSENVVEGSLSTEANQGGSVLRVTRTGWDLWVEHATSFPSTSPSPFLPSRRYLLLACAVRTFCESMYRSKRSYCASAIPNAETRMYIVLPTRGEGGRESRLERDSGRMQRPGGGWGDGALMGGGNGARLKARQPMAHI